MKILHVIPSVATVRGGPSKAILEMVRALIEQNIDVKIVTTNDNGANLLDVPLNQKINYQGIPIIFFSRFSPPINSIREFAFSRDLTTWLIKHIKDYDLIHVHAIFSYASTIAMSIARQQKIPYIVRPLGQLCTWSLTQKAQKKQVYFQLIEKANLEGSKLVHFTAKQEEKEAEKLNLKYQSFVLPLGLNLPQIINNPREKLHNYYQIPNEIPIILFLSRIHEKKGLDLLVTALSQVNQNFCFVIAGSGNEYYEQKIKELIQQNKMLEKVIWTGFVEGELKDILLQGSDLFALTSYSENFGIAVLEALAVGLPVIVTEGVALSSIVAENDLGFVTNLDINSIASTIENILKNPQELKEKSDRSKEFIFNNYTWDKIACNLISIYQQIINKN
ncbi:glycosyltransferase [Geminocystis sp. CENA526]|uniref:glycosyltransferase n=1 Tax=Geminocystis sp. CENA526 TaxID=1355871 RepID=UPI003D6DCDFA